MSGIRCPVCDYDLSDIGRCEECGKGSASMAEITQEERNTLRYYGERAESAQGEILAKAANDADRLARAEALLREARGWCPQGESRGGIGYAVKPPNGVRERIDAFLSDD